MVTIKWLNFVSCLTGKKQRKCFYSCKEICWFKKLFWGTFQTEETSSINTVELKSSRKPYLFPLDKKTRLHVQTPGMKGNYKQGEKTTLRMVENNSKWNNLQTINFQNIQAAHTTQYQKNKQSNENVSKRPKQTFLQRRHTDG